ncbi:MAG: aspartate aminotransferase family protein [Hyphomicrobiaceae bacterium]|nr:aspartate aminotransferase family protein [Hyphomicrobiaceae bacterium]
MSRLLHRQLTTPYPTVARGEGVYLYDTAGKRYLDASGGAAVSCLGHGHPKVVAAIKAQLDDVAYAHTAFFTSRPAEALAEWLVARAPAGFGRAAFVSGGSEAVEGAMKLARQIHLERGERERCHFIARRQSYHGGTLGTLALGGRPSSRAPFEAIFGGGMAMSHIAPCYAYRERRDDESEEEYGLRAAQELEAEILRVGPGKVAAFVAETVSGATLGAVPPAPGYFREIRRICDAYGVLLIVDEVMAGMGRTGHLFAIAEDGVSPDLIAIAKGLGGGYQPIGGVLVRDAHAEALVAGSGVLNWSHTYLAHPVACAAALAVQQVVEEEGLLARVRGQGEALRRMLVARLGQHAHVGDIRGRGLFVGVELVQDRDSKTPFARAQRLAERFKARAMENGLICYPMGGTAGEAGGDHVLLAPPFIISDGELAELTDKLALTLDETLAGTAGAR